MPIPLIAKIFFRDPPKDEKGQPTIGTFVVRPEPDYVRLSLEDRERFRRCIDGAGWDRKLNRWSIRLDQLLSTVQRLEAAEIHVAPHALVLPYLKREDTDAVERVSEADTSIEALEIKLAEKGHILFEFQRADIRFMASRNRLINANEQGLGKTIETLCALPYGGAVLVTCPKEAKTVWERECKEWRSDDYVPIVIENRKQFRLPAAHELLIVNYDILPMCKPDEFPAPLILVADEVHKLKSKGANRSMAVKSYAIRAARAFALTGTPLPNHPNELWSILAVFGLEREVFGTSDRLVELFHGKQNYYYTSVPCDSCRGDGFHDNPQDPENPIPCTYCKKGTRSIPHASGRRWGVCPTNIHRTTDERGRLKRSPDWTPAPAGCEASYAVRKPSAATASTQLDLVDTAPFNAACPVCHGLPMPPEPQVAELLKRVMIRHEKADVLKDLPPKIYKVMGVPLDKKTNREIDDNIDPEVRTALLEAEDLDEVMGLHAGLMQGRRVLAEAKIKYAEQLLDEWEAEGHTAIAFSAHRAPIEHFAKRLGWVAIIGGSNLDRGQIQTDFQAGKYRGLAGTIGAASTALTLTRATRELFIDRSWVPADNDQAEDRAHRIGQTAGLVIVDLVAEHPIDRHVHLLNHRKRGIIRASVGRVKGDRDVNLPLIKAIQRAGNK